MQQHKYRYLKQTMAKIQGWDLKGGERENMKQWENL